MISEQTQTPYLVRPLPLYFLGGLILVNMVAIFGSDPLHIGTLFAFFYIIATPGFLLLPFLAERKLAPALGTAFSVALSMLMLMLAGLGINFILPFFGISQPLTTIPLLCAFDGLIYVLLILNFIHKKESPFEFHNLSARNWMIVGLSLSLPVLACLGAISLNNGGSNFFSMLVLGLSFFLVPIVVMNRRKLSPSDFPIALYMMALSFLLMNSMRGWFVTGHDILLEYHVFTLVNAAHHWSMSLYQDPYMACLSLTIFPTYLQNLLHVNDAYIFKFFIQFIGALPVVLVYFLAKKYASDTIAFLTGFLYITFPTFMVDMAFLNRQGMAFVFFGALIFVLLTPDYFGRRVRAGLLLLLGLGIALSHYSTMYVAVGLFILAYAVNQLLRIAVRTERYRKPNLISLPFVIGLSCILFVWSGLITKTSTSLYSTIRQIAVNVAHLNIGQFSGVASYSLVQSQQQAPQDLFDQYVKQAVAQTRNSKNQSSFFPLSDTQGYPSTLVPEPLLPITRLGAGLQSLVHVDVAAFFAGIKQAYAKIVQLFLLIGIVGLAMGYGFKKNLLDDVPREYVALSISGMGILIGQTVLPAGAVDYGLLRLFQQNLMFLATPIMLGLITICAIVTRKRRVQLFICTGAILFFFAILSGLVSQVIGGARPLLSLNNAGLYYDSYYTHAQEVSSFNWLARNRDSQLTVQADRYFSDRKMLAYTGIAPTPGLLPQTIERNSYVYLDSNNVATGNFIEYIDGIIYYKLPLGFLGDNKNLIYNNGGSEIYH